MCTLLGRRLSTRPGFSVRRLFNVSEQLSPKPKRHDSGVSGPPHQESSSAGMANQPHLSYRFHANILDKDVKKKWNTLVDRGANGGISGHDS